MAKFVFKLDPVIEQRKRAEETLQRELAERERERLAIEERLRACQAGISSARGDLRERLGGGDRVNVGMVRLQASASLHLEARARAVALELAGAFTRAERARQALVKATTARKAVELLRERRLAEWKLERNRREAAVVDELGTMRAARRVIETGDTGAGAREETHG